MNLRDYQQQAVDSVQKNYAAGINKQVTVLATGLGKTVIFSHLIKNIVAQTGKRALVLAHRQELLTQAKEKLSRVDPTLRIDIEQADQYADHDAADVVLASTATIGREGSERIKDFDPNKYGLIVVDEAHHSSASTYQNILRHFGVLKSDPAHDWNKSLLLLGVTATPSRNDNQGIDKIFDQVTFNFGIIDGIKKGWLSRIKAFRISTDTDISHVGKTAGDFNVGELQEAINTPERNALIVKTYKDLSLGKQALCFAVDVQHTEDLCEEFVRQGIVASYVVGTTDKEERDRRLKMFYDKNIQVMVNAMVLTEGYDNEHIQTVLMARPTQSGILYCLDEQTEILTPNGWKKHNEIEVSDRVYGFNLRNNSIIPTIVTGKIQRALQSDEYFYSISSPSLDIRITNKHRMVYDNERHFGWKIAPADNVCNFKKGFFVPCSGNIKKAGVPLTDAEISFLGWYITDGSLSTHTNTITISQREHQPQIKQLEDILNDCNFGYRKYSSFRDTPFNQTSKNVSFVIPYGNPRKGNKTKRNLKHLKKVGWSKLKPYLGKHLSDDLFNMTSEQFDVFIEAIHLGDGSKQLGQTWTRRSYHISSGNQEFADRLQHLAIINGYRTNVSTLKYNKNPIYVIHLKKKQYKTVGGKEQHDRKSFKKEEYKPENVWCIENPLGTIITRRNGKAVIMGQCQMIGRGTRLAEGKQQLTIIDFVDNTARQRLQTSASLIGVNAPMDFKGKDIVSVMDDVEQLKELAPDIDFSKIDIDKIDRIIQEVDILSGLEIPDEVKQYTMFEWHKFNEGEYHIGLGDHDGDKISMQVSETLTGQYEVVGIRFNKILSEEIKKTVYIAPSLEEAIRYSDALINKYYPSSLPLIDSSASWRNQDMTFKQMELLKKMRINETVLCQLKKGSASRLLTKLFSMKPDKRKTFGKPMI